MQAYRVWSTWKDEPDDDAMVSAAFELHRRAEAIAAHANAEHEQKVGSNAACRYVVREETVPRDFTFQGKPDRIVMVFLGDDAVPTDVSQIKGS